MQNFDYIELADFRNSLESDYAEMQRCAAADAWKSAQVLAGSIVECLLVDYLTSRYAEKKEGKDPLKMDLAEAIAACKQGGAITERTADLCTVIRSYRNLIHAGRMVRLQERPPNQASCNIAISLIEMIVEDIAKTRKNSVGFTGEQILSKIKRDEQVLPILKHLLESVREQQRLRLVMEILPSAYVAEPEDEEDEKALHRISAAYRVVFNSLPDNLKTTAVDKFATLIREEDSGTIKTFRRAFFHGYDLEFISSEHLPIVKEHLLDSMRPALDLEDIKAINGMAKYLEPTEAPRWIGPLLSAALSSSNSVTEKKKVKDVISGSLVSTSSEFDSAVSKRLGILIDAFKRTGNDKFVEATEALRDELFVPF